MDQQQRLDRQTAWDKIQRYCGYQERCHSEVRNKLYTYGLTTPEVEELIMDLILSNFINEERFSKAYARGKFKVRQWGRNRIIRELKQRKISSHCIQTAVHEIDDVEYLQVLQKLIDKKSRSIKSTNKFQLNGKVASYCIGKGYESELVWEIINSSHQN